MVFLKNAYSGIISPSDRYALNPDIRRVFDNIFISSVEIEKASKKMKLNPIFKSAEIATATKQYPQALAYYQTIEEKYTSYSLYKESLFLQASLLDNFINDDAKAKVVYEKLIAKYPSSSYANDAKFAIANLGKTDEELHKEFMKKNGEK
jgi:TolA-binding protein